jgi:hypothetical protein
MENNDLIGFQKMIAESFLVGPLIGHDTHSTVTPQDYMSS